MKFASMMKTSIAPVGAATVFIFGMWATVFGTRCRGAGGRRGDAADVHVLRASNRYPDEVRERVPFYLQNSIHSVPAIITIESDLIQGVQSVEVFAQALRQIASQA